MRTRITPNTDTFYAVNHRNMVQKLKEVTNIPRDEINSEKYL